jgi:hypothetical protein
MSKQGARRTLGALTFDHVLIALPDLEEAVEEFEARWGLSSLEGGRHPDWGTANRIVPLGDAYLELIAVVDRGVATRSEFGHWVARAEPGPLGWAVRTDAIEALGLPVVDGSRRRPDGTLLSWRLAGVERAAADPALPFFIEWGEGTPLPGRASTAAGRLVGVTVRPGEFVSVQLETDAGELVI